MRTGAVRTGAWNLNKFSIFQNDFYEFKDILSALKSNLDILRHIEAFLDENVPLIMSAKKINRCALVPQIFLSGAGAVRCASKTNFPGAVRCGAQT